LQLAVRAAGIGPGDEVLVSASTNIATALAVVHNGAIPIPVDSERVTWNLDLGLLEDLIGPRTRAVIPVHLYGHPVDMDGLMALARRHDLVVIEDCAESHGATVRGRMTGSFGQMACFSFYANKVITTGEGGMVTTDDDALADKLRLLRNLAFTVPRFRHEEAGYNYRMTGYQAAMGLSQLRRIDGVVEAKRDLARRYGSALAGIRGLNLPVELDWARNVYWMYAIVVEREFGRTRDELMRDLRTAEIDTRTFFCPMDLQPCLRAIPGFPDRPCPVADELWERGLYLPSNPSLSDDQIGYIADQVRRAAA
jgi:perosamine synthetase